MTDLKELVPPASWPAFNRVSNSLWNIEFGLSHTVLTLELVLKHRREGHVIDYFAGNDPGEEVYIDFHQPDDSDYHRYLEHELRTHIGLMRDEYIPLVTTNLPVTIAALPELPAEIQRDLDAVSGKQRWVIHARRLLNELTKPIQYYSTGPSASVGFPRTITDAFRVCTYRPRLIDDWRESLRLIEDQLKDLRACVPGSDTIANEVSPPPQKTGLSSEEVAEHLEQLRKQGEPFSSQAKLAKRIGCSPATINKAIKSKDSLQIWSKSKAAPKAQSISQVVIGSKAQGRELNPADEAAIREFIEKADPETRAWFLTLSQEDQLAHLDDPDANHNADDIETGGRGRLHKRILNRKP